MIMQMTIYLWERVYTNWYFVGVNWYANCVDLIYEWIIYGWIGVI